VPQEIALDEDLTGRENLMFFAGLHGLVGRRRRERVAAVLEFVDLTARAQDRVGAYSGGMQRRLNIAVALLHEPALVVLDEPTVGVDPQSRNAILEGLEKLRDEGVALCYSSHYLEEVERLCTRIAVMDRGRVLAEGTREQLLGRLGGGSDQISLECEGAAAVRIEQLCELDGVTGGVLRGRTLEFTVREAPRLLPELLAVLARQGARVDGVSVRRPNLESVFLQLTGKALRDD
jgi:ABC-2 type transport system ATP-binding protein